MAAAAEPTVIGVGFMLSALGIHSAGNYAERIASLGLIPPEVGVMKAISLHPGHSQHAIAEEFGMLPSRMVAFIDELEAKGLVERRRSVEDRRMQLLHLTPNGSRMMRKLATIAKQSEDILLRALDEADRETLRSLLTRVAEDQGLTPGVHPGYRKMGRTN